MQHIPDGSSIFTAEAKAVDQTLDFIRTCEVVILTISLLYFLTHFQY